MLEVRINWMQGEESCHVVCKSLHELLSPIPAQAGPGHFNNIKSPSREGLGWVNPQYMQDKLVYKFAL